MVCAHLWVVQLPDIVGENALPTVPAPSLKPEAPMGHHPHRDLPSESLGRQALPPPTLPLQEQLLRLLLSKHHRRHGRPSLCGSASMAPHKRQHNTCGSGVCLPNTSEVSSWSSRISPSPASPPHGPSHQAPASTISQRCPRPWCVPFPQPLVGHLGQDSRWPGQSIGSKRQDGTVEWVDMLGEMDEEKDQRLRKPDTEQNRDRNAHRER